LFEYIKKEEEGFEFEHEC